MLAINSSAQIPDLANNKEDVILKYVQAEIRELRQLFERSMIGRNGRQHNASIPAMEYKRISNDLKNLLSKSSALEFPIEYRNAEIHKLMREAEELMGHCDNKSDHMHFRRLMERLYQAQQDN